MGYARSGQNFRYFFGKINNEVCRAFLSIMLKVGAVRVAMILFLLQEGSSLLCNFEL